MRGVGHCPEDVWHLSGKLHSLCHKIGCIKQRLAENRTLLCNISIPRSREVIEGKPGACSSFHHTESDPVVMTFSSLLQPSIESQTCSDVSARLQPWLHTWDRLSVSSATDTVSPCVIGRNGPH